MKVENSDKTSGTRSASKLSAKKRGGDGTFDSMIHKAEETESQSPVARAASVGALDSLLALQEADGSTSEESNRKARKRASDLMEHLEKVRIGLLTGELPKNVLSQLAHTISTHRDKVMDPRLAEILDEVDLRAQVELA
ncbi:MAG: flagellar assembly protein FliX, partial [Alphaproteobacteria bacterium]|nr:flagellar assembly protein FliX [Alphaproteobacteria bacterium]